MRRFELIAFAVVIAALPLALLLPRTLQGKFYAVLGLPFLAFAAAGLDVLLKRRARRDEPLERVEPELLASRHADPTLPPSGVDTSKWSPELLKRLEWRRFQETCAAYFEVLGFRSELKPFGNEMKVDLVLYEQQSSSPGILVRCRGWNVVSVGIRDVRDLLGVMWEEKVNEGAIVSSASFTEEARTLARKHNIHLLDGADLASKLADAPKGRSAALLAAATEGEYWRPMCPSCGVKMEARSVSKYSKKFWGCPNHPRCAQAFGY